MATERLGRTPHPAAPCAGCAERDEIIGKLSLQLQETEHNYAEYQQTTTPQILGLRAEIERLEAARREV